MVAWAGTEYRPSDVSGLFKGFSRKEEDAMRSTLVAVLAAVVMVVAAGCQTGPAGNVGLPEGKPVADKDAKAIAVTAVAGPIVVDGKLTEAAWNEAIALADFVSGRSGKPAVPTRVLVTYDQNNLYIGVVNEEPNTDKLVAKAEKRDGNVWGDDSDEIYLDPKNEKGRNYYGFFVNAKNVVYDRQRVEAWDGEWTSGTSILEGKAWTVEVAVPWKTIGVTPKPGHKFGLMVARNHHAERTRAQQYYLVPCGAEAKNTSVYPVFELR